MSSTRVAAIVGLAALAGCSRVYHPEYHPETSFHYSQTIQNVYPTTVVVVEPYEPRLAISAPFSVDGTRPPPPPASSVHVASARPAARSPSSEPPPTGLGAKSREPPQAEETTDAVAREPRGKGAGALTWPMVQMQAFTTFWKTPALAEGGVTRARSGGSLYGGNIAIVLSTHERGFLKLAEVRYAASGGPETPPIPGPDGPAGSGRMNLFELGIVGASTILPLGRSASLMFDLDWGAANTWAVVRSPSGDATTARDWHAFVRGQLSACIGRSVTAKGARQPTACATIAPNVHEWGWFNGLSLGLTAQM